jgi:isoquinoline 1-oxidoreductase beta subunit
VEWDEGSLASLSSDVIASGWRGGEQRRANGEGQESRRALAGAARMIEAEYDLPFLAHACMEPMNCTAHARPDGVDVWVPTQAQMLPRIFGGGTRGVAAKAGGVSAEQVRVHTTTLGGGFGRRSEMDFV